MNMKNASLDRFTGCLEKGLLARLDEISAERGCPSRSQAMADFIRRAIAKRDWKGVCRCAGTSSLVYDPFDSRPVPGIESLVGANPKNVLSLQTNLLPGGKTLSTASVTGEPAALSAVTGRLTVDNIFDKRFQESSSDLAPAGP